MSIVPGLLRLERYDTVLEQFKGRKTIDPGTLLLHLKNTTADQLRQDLEALGLPRTPIRIAEFRSILKRTMTQLRQDAGAIGSHTLAGLIGSTAAARVLEVAKPAPLARAQVREAAWNCVIERPDYFVLAHGRLRTHRGKQLLAFPHQLATVNAIFGRFCGQAIVADEVGLGKTLIGALLAFETLERHPETTVLILTPANLVKQWLDEFRLFFGFDLKDHPHAGASELAGQRLVLLSLDRAKGDDLAPSLLARRWDLLLLDEAHEVRTQTARKTMFTYSLHALNRVYLTATPVQNSGYDIYNLSNSLRPGFLNVKADFTAKYMADERSVRQPDVLQRHLSAILTRRRRKDVGQTGFAKRRVITIKIENWTAQERKAYDGLLVMLRDIYRRNLGYATPILRGSGGEDYISQFVLIAILVLREMSSHTSAALKTLDVSLRAQLQKMKAAIEASGAQASASSIRGRDFDLQQLNRFLAEHGSNLEHPEAHSKVAALIKELRRIFKKKTDQSVLVYVCFLESLKLLTRLLEEEFGNDVLVVDFYGNVPNKDTQLTKFQESRRACLVSTDAGGQGQNLQMANTVINYDLPWNPMKIEQRIGRVDRYGQAARTVTVLNLVNTGTIERYVYDTLRTKLTTFEHVVGEIMSPLNVDDILENRLMLGIGELILSSKSTEEMRLRFEGLDEAALHRYMDRYEQYVTGRDSWLGA